MSNLGLKTYNHPHPYPLGSMHNDARLNVTKQCKLKFIIYAKYIDQVMVDVVTLDVCGVILGNTYFWDISSLYHRRMNKYKLIKDRNIFYVNAHNRNKKLPLVTTSQVIQLINTSKLFILLMIKVEESGYIKIIVSMSCYYNFGALMSCKREDKMKRLVKEFVEVFVEIKGLNPI